MKILQIEDSEADSDLIQRLLRRAWPDCQFDLSLTREDLRVKLDKGDYDAILSDYTVPGFSGIEALRVAHEKKPDIPFIFCSGTIGEDRAIDAIRAGATDYVLKGNLSRLVPAVQRAIEEARERKKLREAEAALKRSERRHRSLINAMAEIVWSADATGMKVASQPPWHEFTGAEESGLQNNGWLETLHPEDREGVLKRWTEAINDRKPYHVEFRVKRADGAYRYMATRGVPQIGPEDTIEEWVGVCFDVTDSKEYESQLREKAEVIRQAQEGIVITNLEGKIVFWNNGAEKILGWRTQEVMGRSALDFFDGAIAKALNAVRSKVNQDGVWRGELTLTTREGQPVIVDSHLSLVQDERGLPKGRLNIFSDITDKKELEQQFLRAQRMENLGLLASGISHDLNNILTPILMAAPLLQSRLSNQDDIKLIDTLEQSAQRGAEMVQQILAFARGTGGDTKLIQVRHLIRDIIRIAESTFPKSIAIHHRVSAHLPSVRANPTQIHQLLLNLCVNARDAMPNGGTLTLKATSRVVTQPMKTSLGTIPARAYIVLEVTDTGTGIPPAVLGKMWDPFFTTKGGKGTGLGLSTVRGIIEDHQGFIDVESSTEKGTTFIIYLPANEQTAPDQGDTEEPKEIQGQNEMILIVDDEVSLRDMICTTLEANGFNPIPATSAADVFEKVTRFRGSLRLVITDVSMPEVSGKQIAHIVRELIPSIKILVMSGHGDAERFGDGFIPKPFKPAKLVESIQSLLGTNRAGPSR